MEKPDTRTEARYETAWPRLGRGERFEYLPFGVLSGVTRSTALINTDESDVNLCLCPPPQVTAGLSACAHYQFHYQLPFWHPKPFALVPPPAAAPGGIGGSLRYPP